MELGNRGQVANYLDKAESTPSTSEKKDVLAGFYGVRGLNELKSRSYKKAAFQFIGISFEETEKLHQSLSPLDIAMYGTLCALTAFDRSELKSHLIENTNFKLFMDLDPKIRDLVFSFFNSEYAQCLNKLQEFRVFLHKLGEFIVGYFFLRPCRRGICGYSTKGYYPILLSLSIR
jgi:COP9 signalosome complex subunit 1